MLEPNDSNFLPAYLLDFQPSHPFVSIEGAACLDAILLIAIWALRLKQKRVILSFRAAFDTMEHPLPELAKQCFFIPRTFREKMAQCRAVIRMKTLMMKIGQRS
jgi:hypothetical protein